MGRSLWYCTMSSIVKMLGASSRAQLFAFIPVNALLVLIIERSDTNHISMSRYSGGSIFRKGSQSYADINTRGIPETTRKAAWTRSPLCSG